VEGLSQSLSPIHVSLIPGEAKEIGWDALVPLNVDALRWEVEVKGKTPGWEIVLE